jgi:hypothetical protein
VKHLPELDGFQPTHTIQQGLAESLSWYVESFENGDLPGFTRQENISIFQNLFWSQDKLSQNHKKLLATGSETVALL